MASKTAKTTTVLERFLAPFNKTEQEKQSEKVEKFIEDSIIDCEEQINSRESDIKRAEGAIKSATRDLERAQANLEVVKYSTASNFQEYLHNLSTANSKIDQARWNLEGAEEVKAELEKEKTQLEEVLGYFQA